MYVCIPDSTLLSSGPTPFRSLLPSGNLVTIGTTYIFTPGYPTKSGLFIGWRFAVDVTPLQHASVIRLSIWERSSGHLTLMHRSPSISVVSRKMLHSDCTLCVCTSHETERVRNRLQTNDTRYSCSDRPILSVPISVNNTSVHIRYAIIICVN